LTSKQLASNRYSARLVANAAEQGLNKRLDWLEQSARHRLYQATIDGNKRELQQILKEVLAVKGEPIDLFTEATVADAQGKLLAQVRVVEDGAASRRKLRVLNPARYPHRQYSWRDWFSGQGDHKPGTVLPPITRPHISAPYVSSDPDRMMFISISVPIRNPDQLNGKVVGVLEGAVLLKQMNDWLDRANIDTDGFAVLFDARGHCVLHRDRSFAPTPEHGARQFLTPEQQDALFPEREGILVNHKDPVDERSYLASYARMGERIGWVALVQHDREKTIAPIEQLRDRLNLIGLVTFGLVAGLVSGLWGWLFWALHRAEQLSEG
jgi:hypothetical protein